MKENAALEGGGESKNHVEGLRFEAKKRLSHAAFVALSRLLRYRVYRVIEFIGFLEFVAFVACRVCRVHSVYSAEMVLDFHIAFLYSFNYLFV